MLCRALEDPIERGKYVRNFLKSLIPFVGNPFRIDRCKPIFHKYDGVKNIDGRCREELHMLLNLLSYICWNMRSPCSKRVTNNAGKAARDFRSLPPFSNARPEFGIRGNNNGPYLSPGFHLIIFYVGISFRCMRHFDLFTDPYPFTSMWYAIVLDTTHVRHGTIRDNVAKPSRTSQKWPFRVLLLNVK